jgi:inosine-uridine nucleoside N-ribohydrolase
MKNRRRVIVDCDNTYGLPGLPIDDGQTIMYLAGRDDIEIVGITCTHGNGQVSEVYDATRWLLGALGLGDIPVLKGASGPGDFETEAADWLARIIDAEPGNLDLLAIGTMTNLLAAQRKNPSCLSMLRSITAMGGYLYPLPVRGWNRIGEVNLSRDPEATAALLHASCPVTVMSAQICLQAPFGIDELAPIAESDRASYQYMLSYLLGMIRRHGGAQEYLWDLLPAVYLSHPELFHRNEVRISTDPATLSGGYLLKSETGTRINLPDYIVDIDALYAYLYAAWKRAPLKPI